jgi:FKBP-type peptidyl-prolyl cis-trans isomerase
VAEAGAERLEAYNKRIQNINRVPDGFPTFVRDGYEVKIKYSNQYTKLPSGLIIYDFNYGKNDGPTPQDGQKVIFHYTAYNENGARIDTSYNGKRPLEQVVGIGGMVPGFEEGIKGMHIGGQRRIIVPPELGPPVGPSTFFSAKQYEVFDVELIDILSCRRQGFAITSSLVCDKGVV